MNNKRLGKRSSITIGLLSVVLLIVVLSCKSKVEPAGLRCEYLANPLGIDVSIPRLSWQIRDAKQTRGQKQTAFHLLVASSPVLLDQNQGDLWDSGKITSAQSALIPYAGSTLHANQDCYWKVRVFDKDGIASKWSQPARFSIGLLSHVDWTASWIKHPQMNKTSKKKEEVEVVEASSKLPVEQHLWFRKKLKLSARTRTAFLHVASCGYHELYVNGQKADDRYLAPAQSRLDKRILYVTYDIADLLVEGDNVIAFWTGPGWSRYEYFHTFQALRVQLNGEDEAGKNFSLQTGTDWRCHAANSKNRGGIKYKDHGGEIIDARAFVEKWNLPEFDDSAWLRAEKTVLEVELSSQMMEPTRIIETIPSKSISDSLPYRIDMGKNFTGWLEIKMRGQQEGDRITIKISDDVETVQDFGQLNEYICKGGEEEIFRNRFNFIAGRYVTIEGLRHKPVLNDVKGLVLASDIERVGHFNSSKELFNKIYEVDLWTYRANTVEGFTMDCPHRERLGYGEVAFATAWGIGMPNYKSGAFYMKHVRDWSDVQEDNGWINHTAPQVNHHFGGPMWSSAGLNIASAFYQTYGDTQIFEQIYPAALRWMEFLNASVEDSLLVNYMSHRGKFLGDWAAPKQRKEWGNTTEAQYFNNCVYIINLAEVVQMAQLLGKDDDAAVYEDRLKALKHAVHQRFFNPQTNLYSNGTQVQQAFALMARITPDTLRSAVFAHIEKDLTLEHAYLDMGSSGLPVLFKFMTEESERSELLFKALSSTAQPSYGYFLARGESTWPEYWNVDVPSRIHTCYTGVASWMMKSLAGIRPDPSTPGFQSFIIQPTLAGDLSFAEASTESLYGKISSHWKRDAKHFTLSVTIPPNSQATVYVPTGNPENVTENEKPMSDVVGVTPLPVKDGYAVFLVESGSYEFMADIR